MVPRREPTLQHASSPRERLRPTHHTVARHRSDGELHAPPHPTSYTHGTWRNVADLLSSYHQIETATQRLITKPKPQLSVLSPNRNRNSAPPTFPVLTGQVWSLPSYRWSLLWGGEEVPGCGAERRCAAEHRRACHARAGRLGRSVAEEAPRRPAHPSDYYGVRDAACPLSTRGGGICRHPSITTANTAAQGR